MQHQFACTVCDMFPPPCLLIMSPPPCFLQKIWKSQIMQTYSNSIILNDVWLTIMVPDCFIMSDAPYYLDICIVHNLYPSPLTLPLPSPSFPPTNKTHRFLTNCATRIVPFLNGGGGGTLVSWHFPRGLNLPLYPPPPLQRSTPPPPFPPTNKTHWFSTNGATRIVPFLNGGGGTTWGGTTCLVTFIHMWNAQSHVKAMHDMYSYYWQLLMVGVKYG